MTSFFGAADETRKDKGMKVNNDPAKTSGSSPPRQAAASNVTTDFIDSMVTQ